MLKDSLLGIVRHAMTIAGGYLAGAGHLSPTEVETLIGAVVAIGGIVWSILQKLKKESAT